MSWDVKRTKAFEKLWEDSMAESEGSEGERQVGEGWGQGQPSFDPESRGKPVKMIGSKGSQMRVLKRNFC